MTTPAITTPSPAETWLDETVVGVQAAQRLWGGWTPRQRARSLGSLRRRIVDEQDALIETIAQETAKPVAEIATQEVTAALGLLQFCETHYPAWLRGRRFRYYRPGFWTKSNTVRYDPLGVVAVIGPANFPFSLVTMQAGAALMCGNGVVIKPSERCPQTARFLRRFFATSALPDHVVEVVEGGAETAHQLIAHPAVEKVIFTGSSETGAYIAELCGRYFKPCILELGGEGLAIVCDDADVKLAARGLLWSTLYANGGSCIGTRRVLALPGIRPALIDALTEEYQALRLGPPHDPATEVSEGYPLHLEAHPSDTGAITSFGEEALAKSVKPTPALRATPPGEGTYLEYAADVAKSPLERGAERSEAGCVNQRHDPARPEQNRPIPSDRIDFLDDAHGKAPRGPVLRVEEVATLDAAIEAVNASPYGLSASVWSRDARAAQAVARRLRVGMVWINDASAALPTFPWGGLRRSGWGRLFAREALPALTHLKVISHDHRRTARPKFWWFPYCRQHFELTLALNAFLFGQKNTPTLRRLGSALWRYLARRK